MNILLTGGTGYIGSHTAVELSQQGHNVFLYDSLVNSTDDVIEKLLQITGVKCSLVIVDVRDTGKWRIQARSATLNN